jgi:peptide deformylase
MELIYYPHPALTEPTKDIHPGDWEDLESRIREMFEIMYRNKGVGLAGPQVAWSVNLCIINPTGEEKDELVLLNPKIVSTEGAVEDEEGCLSFPGIYAKVRRANAVVVEYEDQRFEPKRMDCNDLMARIVQHELDHLDNVLLVHRMSKTDKFKNRKRLEELKAVPPL